MQSNQNSGNLDQQLLELVYDVLPDKDAAELRRRIESDPAVAQAYEQAQRAAGLLASAARLHQPTIPLSDPNSSSEHNSTVVAGRFALRVRQMVAIAAAVLVAVSGGGYLYQQTQERDLSANHLRLLVTGPTELQAGLTNYFTVNTTTVTGVKLPVQLEWAVYTRDGEKLLEKRAETDESGSWQWRIPGGWQSGKAGPAFGEDWQAATLPIADFDSAPKALLRPLLIARNRM